MNTTLALTAFAALLFAAYQWHLKHAAELETIDTITFALNERKSYEAKLAAAQTAQRCAEDALADIQNERREEIAQEARRLAALHAWNSIASLN